MKTTQLSMLLAAGLTSLLAASARAQITTPFPSGINLFAEPAYANNVTHYASALGTYYFASDANVPSVISASADGWTAGPVDFNVAFGGSPWLATGGTVKAIYLGETAGWSDDFGYISSADPSNHIALATDVQGQVNLFSGAEAYVNYGAGATLDFFLNSGGPQGEGGLFYAFGTSNEYAGGDLSEHIKWKVLDVTTTYVDTNGDIVENSIKTLLVGFEDTRQGITFYDGDSNDFVVGFQFLPLQLQSVPEPATFGLLGAIALCGLIGYRRFKAVKARRLASA